MLPRWGGGEELWSMIVMVESGPGLMKLITIVYNYFPCFHHQETPGSPRNTEPSGTFQQFNQWTIQWGFVWGSAAMELLGFDF